MIVIKIIKIDVVVKQIALTLSSVNNGNSYILKLYLNLSIVNKHRIPKPLAYTLLLITVCQHLKIGADAARHCDAYCTRSTQSLSTHESLVHFCS